MGRKHHWCVAGRRGASERMDGAGVQELRRTVTKDDGVMKGVNVIRRQ